MRAMEEIFTENAVLISIVRFKRKCNMQIKGFICSPLSSVLLICFFLNNIQTLLAMFNL